MKYGSWARLTVVAACTSACCFVASSCAKTDAQTVASPQSCHAEIAVSDTTSQCPAAHIKFHVSVSDCDNSSGTFEYDYIRASEGVKPTIHSTGTWSSLVRQQDHVETVPVSCDAEVGNVTNAKVTACHCSD